MESAKTVIRANGDRWQVVTHGSGPALVFLHGYPLDHRLWRAQLEEFSTDWTVLAPDFPGFGRSPTTTHPCGMKDLAEGVAEVLERMHIDQPIVLCGLSMGGYVALEFWNRFSDRLRGLIFCNSRVSSDTAGAREQRLKVAESVHREGIDPIISAMLPKLLAPAALDGNGLVVGHVVWMMRQATPSGIAAVQRGMAKRDDFQSRLSQIKIPVLCVAGSSDPIVPPDELQSIAQQLPHGEFVTIAEAAHLPPVEQPERFNEALAGFLQKFC